MYGVDSAICAVDGVNRSQSTATKRTREDSFWCKRRFAAQLSNQTSTPKIFGRIQKPISATHCHSSNHEQSKFHTFLFSNQCSLHPELAPDVQKNDDTNERERGDEDLGRSDLQTRAVVGVKLQDVLSTTGPAAATGRCCASLCWSLLRQHVGRKHMPFIPATHIK